MLDIPSLVRETRARLEACADPERQQFTEGYFPSAMSILGVKTGDFRVIARDLARVAKGAPPDEVLALARGLIDDGSLEGRQVAYELVSGHKGAMAALNRQRLEQLGYGIDNWVSVDTFACTLSGPAWRRGQIDDATIEAWLAQPDRWWRRAAVVSTVPLNLKSRGGEGDPKRTLEVCERVVDDPDEMVGKGLSWALRELAKRDPAKVEAFLERHGDRLQARVRREVRNKLVTGLKTPRSVST